MLIRTFAAVTLLLSAFVSSTAQAESVFSFGYSSGSNAEAYYEPVWVPGYWIWNGHRDVYVEGQWVQEYRQPRYTQQYYTQPYYSQQGHGRHYERRDRYYSRKCG